MMKIIVGPSLIASIVGLLLVSGYMLPFVFLYPFYMSFIWIVGGIYFYFHWERRGARARRAPIIQNPPLVSILIPCFDEGDNLADTIAAALRQTYKNFEIIAINDGSCDATGTMLDALSTENPKLRVVHFVKNQGKAMALRMGALVARGEFLVCIDGDAILEPESTTYLTRLMVNTPRVGAVTGNPRIRTRSTLIGRVQVGEFSSIIGLIKRAQRIYGTINTVSGVIVAYRRSALHHCGYWSLDMVTEDIDVSWMLRANHWTIQYEPDALCWILMPETVRGLWKQRLRWAQGGAEVYLKQINHMFAWDRHPMWALSIEYCMSLAWVWCFVASLVLWAIGKLIAMPRVLDVPSIEPPAFLGLLLATICLVQFCIALAIEQRYERKLFRSIVWVIWYPFFFWFVMLTTSLVGFPKALFGLRGKRAVWVSPDRGIS